MCEIKSGKNKKRLRFNALLCVIIMALSIGTSVDAKTTIQIGTFVPLDEYHQLYGPQMEEFQQLNPDIELDVLYIANNREYAAKLSLLAATGDIPDVFMIPPEQAAPVVHAGLVEDLTPYYDRDIDDLYAWFPVALDAVRFGGITFGVPGYFVNYTYAYNKSIMAERGLANPAADEWVTWDYISDTAKKLTIKRGDGEVDTWGYNHGLGYVEVLPLIFQAGGHVFDENDLVHIDHEPAYLAIDWLNSMIRDGTHGGTRAMFFEGKVSTNRLGSWQINERTIASADDIETTSGTQFKEKNEVVYLTSFAMGIGTKHRDEAWRFLQFIPSRQSQTFVVERGRVPIRGDVTIHSDSKMASLLGGFVQSITHATPYPYHVHSDQIQRAFDQSARVIWSGDAPAQSVFPQIERSINAFLGGGL